MAGSDRDRRVSDASSLQKAIEAVLKVDGPERQKIIHDRLMESIQDARDAAKERNGGRAPFTELQINVLKDIAYRVVHIADPGNKTHRRFWSRFAADIREQNTFEQIKIFAVIVGLFFTLGTALYAWAQMLGGYFFRH